MSKKIESEPIRVSVAGRNMPISEPLRQYVINKMDRLTRFLDRLSSVEIMLASENAREASGRNVAEATATAGGRTIRAESSDANMYAAIDGLVDKLHHQLTRTKERSRDHKHKSRDTDSGPEVEILVEDIDDLEDLDTDGREEQIVEVKQYTLKPMFSDEAIDEMNELGHAFFVFLSARTEKVSVVYRRRDGLYGLIEPAFV